MECAGCLRHGRFYGSFRITVRRSSPLWPVSRKIPKNKPQTTIITVYLTEPSAKQTANRPHHGPSHGSIRANDHRRCNTKGARYNRAPFSDVRMDIGMSDHCDAHAHTRITWIPVRQWYPWQPVQHEHRRAAGRRAHCGCPAAGSRSVPPARDPVPRRQRRNRRP